MNKFYVYFDDDYADTGGFGFQEFEDVISALGFIEERMKQDHERTLEHYTLIEGKKRKLMPVTQVVKLTVVDE